MFGDSKQREQQDRKIAEKTVQEKSKVKEVSQAKVDEKSWWEKFGTTSTERPEGPVAKQVG